MLAFFGLITAIKRDDFEGLLKAEVTLEDISHTRLKIPYGAALRYQEAVERKIFDKFVVAFPNVVEHKISRDPAILGVKYTSEGDAEMYMVVYWDLERDKARVIKQIKDFGKFKV